MYFVHFQAWSCKLPQVQGKDQKKKKKGSYVPTVMKVHLAVMLTLYMDPNMFGFKYIEMKWIKAHHLGEAADQYLESMPQF